MELLGRFGRAVWGALCAAGCFLGWLWGGLFGRMQWRAPGWLKWTGNKGLAGAHVVKARPWRSALIAFGTMAVLAGGWFGYRWYESRPKPYQPPLITFEV